ncbi:hypothetical protein [Spirulina sp. 06S082]|uniref:hypothetical protein n=1 Tax=Spirulina sp. 06S082 TaxID=3110248 RepID=UPI002B20A64A|nr:hypothetical protein [Spirulina sp. 06S082]MEA5472303.1 hypothetical protein [Spirulina sp. 06S082]
MESCELIIGDLEMRCLPQSSAIASLSAIVLFLASGCGTSKIAQCNSVINIANGVAEEAKKLTNEGQTKESQAMLQAADVIDKASQDMQALELSDETLQKFRTEFVTMYEGISKSTRTFVEAFEKKDRPGLDASLANLQRATQPEQELANGIVSYCQGN